MKKKKKKTKLTLPKAEMDGMNFPKTVDPVRHLYMTKLAYGAN